MSACTLPKSWHGRQPWADGPDGQIKYAAIDAPGIDMPGAMMGESMFLPPIDAKLKPIPTPSKPVLISRGRQTKPPVQSNLRSEEAGLKQGNGAGSGQGATLQCFIFSLVIGSGGNRRTPDGELPRVSGRLCLVRWLLCWKEGGVPAVRSRDRRIEMASGWRAAGSFHRGSRAANGPSRQQTTGRGQRHHHGQPGHSAPAPAHVIEGVKIVLTGVPTDR